MTENPNHTPTKIFQPQKMGKPFQGTLEEEGSRARTFIAKIEMTRQATPNLTDAQLVTTAAANLQGADEA